MKSNELWISRDVLPSPRQWLILVLLVLASAAGVRGDTSATNWLAGRVIDETGAGLEGVQVVMGRAGATGSSPVATRATDDRGYFHFATNGGLHRLEIETSDGSWSRTVLVTHPTVLSPLVVSPDTAVDDSGWSRSHSARRPISQAENPRPGGFILGRAVESRVLGSGGPVPGAWAWVEGHGESAVLSASDGSYRLPAPGDRGAGLRIVKRGFLPARAPAPQVPKGQTVRGWTVVLHPASYLAGRVTDSFGNPVSASLELNPVEPSAARTQSVSPDLARAFTEGSGRFYVPTLPDEHVELTVRAPGYTDTVVRLRTPPAGGLEDGLQWTLSRRLDATGTVLDVDDRPVAGALVAPVPWGDDDTLLRRLARRTPRDGDLAAAETDRLGRFVLRDLPTGRYSLVVTADSFEPVAVSGLEVSGDRDSVPLGTIFLAAAARVSGEVVDPSGEPVPGADVRVGLLAAGGRSSTGRAGDSITTGASGEFVVGGLARGSRITLEIHRDGYLPSRVPAVDVPTEDPLRIELTPAAGLTGRVTDYDRNPVEGARVTARPQGERGAFLRQARFIGAEAGGVTTDADGVYRLRQVVPGPTVLSVEADCCLPWTEVVDADAGDGPNVIDVRLAAGESIRGRVVSAEGKPLSEVGIAGGGHFTRSDERGRFHLAGLPSGGIDLELEHPAHGAHNHPVEAGREAEVTIRWPETGQIAGRVVDGSDVGIPRATVRLRCAGDSLVSPLRADATGRFRRAVVPGPCTVSARADGYLPAAAADLRVLAGEPTSVTLTLEEGALLRGRVVGAESFELARAHLLATAPGQAPVTGRVDPSGGFEIPGLAPGPWRVSITLPDGRRGSGSVDVAPGQDEAFLELDLERGRELEGIVRLDGEPLAGAWISVATLDGVRLAHTLSGPSGTFTVRGLDPDLGSPPEAPSRDAVQVDVSSPQGDLHWSRTVGLPRATPLEIDVWTGRLGGRVIDSATGFGIDRARVEAAPLGDSTWVPVSTPPTSPDGGFGPWRLPEGRYRLTIGAPDFETTTMEVEVTRDRETTLDVPISRAVPGTR